MESVVREVFTWGKMFGVARVSFKLERGTPFFFVPAWKGSPHITRTTHSYADTQTHTYADPHT